MSRRHFAWLAIFVSAWVVLNAALLSISGLNVLPTQDRIVLRSDSAHPSGFVQLSYIDESGEVYPFFVYVPHGVQKEGRPPLMIYLNGLGENGRDGLAPLRNGLAPAIWQTQRHFPCVTVFLQCPEGEAWVNCGDAVQRGLRISDLVAKKYHTDPDRVYLTGLSAGGTGVWAVAACYPERFAAIAPISAGGTVNLQWAEAIATANIPVWSFYVRGDAQNILLFNRGMHKTLLKHGSYSVYSELNGERYPKRDMHNAWNFAYRNPALIPWLLRQSKPRNRKRVTNPLKLIEWDKAGASALPGNWEIAGDELTCQQQAGCLDILRCDFPQEIQFEVCPQGMAAFNVILSSDSNSPEAGSYRIEFPVQGNTEGGLFDAQSNKWLAPLMPYANVFFMESEWNDIQITLSQDRLILRVNQCVVIDHYLEKPISKKCVMSWEVDSGVDSHASDIVWRFLRVQGSDSQALLRPSHLASRQRPEPAADAELENIIQSWKARRSKANEMQLTWQPEVSNGQRYRSSVYADNVPADVVDTLQLESTSATYFGTWWFPRAKILPSGKFDPCASEFPDYKRIFEKGLSESSERNTKPAKWIIQCEQSQFSQLVNMHESEDSGGIITCRPSAEEVSQWCMDNLVYRAPLLLTRPFESWGGGVSEDALTLLSKKVLLNGRWCDVLDEVRDDITPGLARRYYVDPQQDNAILRYSAFLGTKLFEQVDFEYAKHPVFGYVPSRWSCLASAETHWSHSLEYHGLESLYDRLEITVEAVSATAPEMSVDFSPGTVLYDHCRGNWYKMTGQESKRPLTKAEYAALLFDGESEPQQAPFLNLHRGTILSLLVILSLVFVAYRRQRRLNLPNSIENI